MFPGHPYIESTTVLSDIYIYKIILLTLVKTGETGTTGTTGDPRHIIFKIILLKEWLFT